MKGDKAGQFKVSTAQHGGEERARFSENANSNHLFIFYLPRKSSLNGEHLDCLLSI